jgi:nicotinamidase/pyrazinamidase
VPHYDGAMSSLPTPPTPQRPRYDTWTALVVVDVQNDFADPRGGLAVAGATGILTALEGEIAAARAAGSLVVYTQDWHPADTPHFAKDGGIWPVHCVHETWGADFHPRLTRDGPVVRKGTNGEDGYSGFSMRDPVSGETTPTELVDLLRQRSIERVVVVGLATDYCVRATALDAHALGFGTTVVRDAVAAVDLAPGDGAKALADLAAVGVELA